MYLFVVFRLGVVFWFFLTGESGEVECVVFDLRHVEYHGRVFLDEHFLDGPPRHVDRGGLTADYVAGAAGIKTAAARNGKNFRDARSARDRNMFARRKHGRGRNHLGIGISRFRRIDGSAERADLPDAHLSNRVKDSVVDLQTFGINHLGLGGNVQTGADGGDFSVTDNEAAVFNGVPGNREDFLMRDRIGGWWLRLSSR